MNVIIDTREKQPWNFSIYGLVSKSKCLSCGDYTLEGMEHILFIERKKSPGEIAANLGRNVNRFKKELDKTKDIKYKYIICEFSFAELIAFPNESNLPLKREKQVRIKGPTLIKTLTTLCDRYEITLIFCKNKEKAEEKAYEIIKGIINEE